MPLFGLGFEAAATEWDDEFYTNTWSSSAGTIAQTSQGLSHPGCLQITTGNAIGNTGNLFVRALMLANLDQCAFVFKTGASITSTVIAIGINDGYGPTASQGIRLALNSGETKWRIAKTAAGVDTGAQLNNTVTINTWYLFRIRRLGPGHFLGSITNLATGTVETQEHTGIDENTNDDIYFWVRTDAASSRHIIADYFWIRHASLVRA
jgi:hypothetical protein